MKRNFIITRDLGIKEGEGKNGKYSLHDLEVAWNEVLLTGETVRQTMRVTSSHKLKQDVLQRLISEGTEVSATVWFSTSIYNGSTYNNIKIWLPKSLRHEE